MTLQTVCDWLNGSFCRPGKSERMCMHILSDFPGRQNNQFFRRPTYRPVMTGRGAALALFLYDIHAGLPDRHNGLICRPVNPRVAHRLYTDHFQPLHPSRPNSSCPRLLTAVAILLFSTIGLYSFKTQSQRRCSLYDWKWK